MHKYNMNSMISNLMMSSMFSIRAMIEHLLKDLFEELRLKHCKNNIEVITNIVK